MSRFARVSRRRAVLGVARGDRGAHDVRDAVATDASREDERWTTTSSASNPKLPAIDLERALAALPDTQRLVVVLHDVEGFTHQEIAEQLGMAAGTSKATLFRARRALRAALNGGMQNAN